MVAYSNQPVTTRNYIIQQPAERVHIRGDSTATVLELTGNAALERNPEL